jgi:hypothetical protein
MSSRDDKYEIIPPSRAVAPRPSRSALTPARPQPLRIDTGGIISSIPKRWEANSNTRTYDAFARRANAQRALVDADTSLGKSLIANARMRHEFSELPDILATDRAKRQLARYEELRDLRHQVELAEARRQEQLADAEVALTQTRTRLTAAREQLTIARRGQLNAEQEFDAQREHGRRYHDLGWQHRIGEYELSVEEQKAVLSEHRKRTACAEDDVASAEEELLQRRSEMNADGLDTAKIDAKLERMRRRPLQ